MKKLLWIVVLGLMLTGCGSGYSMFNAFIDEDYANGGLIWNHYMSSTGYEGVSRLANSSCSAKGFSGAKLGTAGKQGEFKTYRFTCVSKSVQTAKNKVELASMIGKAKSTCKNLGFTPGTEKFADCGLKLYSQSVELAAKNNQTVVMQPQSSGSNVMTIYDPVRDNQRLMDQGMKMITGRCTLGYDC